MASRDLYHSVKHVSALDPVVLSATTNGAIVDTKGYESVTFVVQTGVATAGPDASNYITVTIQEGDSATLTDAATVTAANTLGTAPVIDAAGDASNEFRFGFLGTKRYARLVFTETGTFSAPASALAILGHPLHAPVA